MTGKKAVKILKNFSPLSCCCIPHSYVFEKNKNIALEKVCVFMFGKQGHTPY